MALKWAEIGINRISPVNKKTDGADVTATAGTALIALLGTMGAIGPLSMDMYLPSLPTLASYFST